MSILDGRSLGGFHIYFLLFSYLVDKGVHYVASLSLAAGCCSIELVAEMAAVSPGFGVNEICWGDDWV